jgi:hypothetical protein
MFAVMIGIENAGLFAFGLREEYICSFEKERFFGGVGIRIAYRIQIQLCPI